jgi:replicative DNA helicase
MAGSSQPIDLLTAIEYLRVNGRLDEVGGAVALERLHESTPTAAHAPFYIDVVRQKHLLRTVINTATDAQAKCYAEAQGADLILSETEQAFLGISEQQKSDVIPFARAIRNTIARIEHGFDHGPGSLSGISTGFRNLDRWMYGLRPAEMIVLAARPSMGKTSLAMNICEKVALGEGSDRKPRPVGIFSCEMSQEALVLRMLCARAKVSSQALNQGFTNQAEAMQKLTRAATALEKAPIYIDDTGGLDIMDLRARARRMRKKNGVELIMIDYLQLLNSREYAAQGRQLETANISANVKAMAKELKIPVIVLSQLSRAPEQRDKSGKPKLSDLRDSGAIEQDADVVLMLRRPCKYPGDEEHDDLKLAIVDVAKHRNGPTGEVRLEFIDEYTSFEDRTGQHADADADIAIDATNVGI